MSSKRRARPSRRIALPSAGQTIVSLVLSPVAEGGPWPLTRVLTALSAFDVQRTGVARAVGDRRGIPLIHSQELRWGGHEIFLEARHGAVDELSCELPPGDELDGLVEDTLWGFIDTVAAAADARFGSVGDGEPAEIALPDDAAVLLAHLRRHLALLLPEWMAGELADAGLSASRRLDASGLLVVAA